MNQHEATAACRHEGKIRVLRLSEKARTGQFELIFVSFISQLLVLILGFKFLKSLQILIRVVAIKIIEAWTSK